VVFKVVVLAVELLAVGVDATLRLCVSKQKETT
jgi:hypothetical protein